MQQFSRPQHRLKRYSAFRQNPILLKAQNMKKYQHYIDARGEVLTTPHRNNNSCCGLKDRFSRIEAPYRMPYFEGLVKSEINISAICLSGWGGRITNNWWACVHHVFYCKFEFFRGNFIIANGVKIHICDDLHVNSRLRHDLPITVNDRVILPFCEDFTFAKLRICEVSRK